MQTQKEPNQDKTSDIEIVSPISQTHLTPLASPELSSDSSFITDNNINVTSTPPSPTPVCKEGRFKSQSAITTALALGTTTGLMRFFKWNTPEQYHKQVQRETEESRKLFNKQKGRQGIRKAEKSKMARASNHECQQKHWVGLYKEQIRTRD